MAITTDGKQIIAKYLLGQAPSFASHIAAGVGARPVNTGEEPTISPSIQSLDFEAFRVPIAAKGFIKEGGVEKIVFKAEMPTSQRYLISEVGLYPSANNAVAGKYDSKLLVTFTPTEQWTYISSGVGSAVNIQQTAIDDSVSNIVTPIKAQFINSDASVFNNTNRSLRLEPPRLLNKALMVSGSTTFLPSNFSNLEYVVPASASYIQNSTLNFDLSQNNKEDKIKIALSLLSKTATNNTAPNEVRILMQFINNVSNTLNPSASATLAISLDSSNFEVGGNQNRYIVIEKSLSELKASNNFSYANINLIKIFTSVIVGGVESGNYYVVYDGIRLDNISSPNPLYSLVGYSIIENTDRQPILKQENTNNYIEYRFGIGVS
jgi:hypothetical protein